MLCQKGRTRYKYNRTHNMGATN